MAPGGEVGELRHNVTVDRRIAPPTAAPERRVILSHHAAPQCPEACHAYLAGDIRDAPAFSHHGSVHGALVDYFRAHGVDHHRCDQSQCSRHGGSTTHKTDSTRAAF